MANWHAMEHFVANLTAAISAQKLTWTQVAERSGVDMSNLSRIRHGKESCSLDRASVIAEAAGFELWQLLKPDFSQTILHELTAKNPAA